MRGQSWFVRDGFPSCAIPKSSSQDRPPIKLTCVTNPPRMTEIHAVMVYGHYGALHPRLWNFGSQGASVTQGDVANIPGCYQIL